jgi:hypothetical protein
MAPSSSSSKQAKLKLKSKPKTRTKSSKTKQTKAAVTKRTVVGNTASSSKTDDDHDSGQNRRDHGVVTTTTTKKGVVVVGRKVRLPPQDSSFSSPHPSSASAAVPITTAIPSDYPVSSCYPAKEYPPTASALRVGSLLLNNCNGQDVHIAKNATIVPSIDKERGKFLLIFPGTFSFQDNTNNINANNTTTTTTSSVVPFTKGDQIVMDDTTAAKEVSPAPINEEQHVVDMDVDGTNKEVTTTTTATTMTTSTSTSTSTSTVVPPSMGRLMGLRSETPSFHVPFGTIQKTLIFPGKKILTSTKYLMLSCSNKKSGSVSCKVRYRKSKYEVR